MKKSTINSSDIIKYANYFVKNQSTLRKTAQFFGVSKSCLHKYFTRKLKTLNKKLFAQTRKILQKNKDEKHIRGGLTTKQKAFKQHF